MFNRTSRHTRQLLMAPEPSSKPPRMVTLQAFGADKGPSHSPCSMDCLQSFRHGHKGATNIFSDGPEAHSQSMIWSWCGDHDYLGEANDMLRHLFNSSHANGDLYPGTTRHCYDQEHYHERWYCISELLPCDSCHQKFLSADDLTEHCVVEHSLEDR